MRPRSPLVNSTTLLDHITLTEAASIAGCARQWIAQLIDAGKLPALTVAGRRYVKRSDAEAITLRKAQLA